MSELREMPIQQMNLSEKEQFNYAKFIISVDELEDELFVNGGTDRESVKNTFFEVYNNNPNKDFAWIFDTVFNLIIDKMSYSERKQNLLGLAALRFYLTGDSKNNFESTTTKDLFVGKTVPSEEISSKESIIASSAVSGDTGNILITDKEIHPLDYIDSPAAAWAKAQEPAKDEPIN